MSPDIERKIRLCVNIDGFGDVTDSRWFGHRLTPIRNMMTPLDYLVKPGSPCRCPGTDPQSPEESEMESSQYSTERLLSLFNKVPTEELTELYERHGVENVSDLVTEICRDGSNSITTWAFRFGEGVNYDEIVMAVASKVGLEYNPSEVADESELELLVVQHLVKRHFDSLSPEERVEFEKRLNELGEQYKDFWGKFCAEAAGVALPAIVQRLGAPFVARLLAPIMARLLMVRGLAVVGPRLVGLAVPFLNVALAVWLAIDIAGPAYRKTVPTVFQVALLRLQHGK